MSQKEVLVLVAGHFDEMSAIYPLYQMRAEGILTRLVGLNSGLQTGLRGLKVRPDMSLAQVDPHASTRSCRLLILAGGPDCTVKLRSDPRVHQLVITTLEAGGFVAAMAPESKEAFSNNGAGDTATAAHLLFQGENAVADFVDHLIDRVAA